jgi:hypothetical protein
MTTSAALERCRSLVEAALRELVGERLVADAAAGVFGFREGSAWLTVTVRPAPDGEPQIATRSWLVDGAEPTQELLHHLLLEADRPPFGAFGIDAREVVFLEHVLPGTGADPAQVRTVVAALAAFADRADDELVARFGGIRMTDPRPTGAGGT